MAEAFGIAGHLSRLDPTIQRQQPRAFPILAALHTGNRPATRRLPRYKRPAAPPSLAVGCAGGRRVCSLGAALTHHGLMLNASPAVPYSGHDPSRFSADLGV